ncbi:MAG: hypothetical protein P8049_01595 [Gemmatimonadota bacterium]|jgi:hypothetical protein
MLNAQPSRLSAWTILVSSLLLLPRGAVAQDEHGAAVAGGAHDARTELQDHGSHVAHEKNELAIFLGATDRLKFDDDEIGGTIGFEYMRQIRPRVAASIGAEFAAGDIERDWVAMLKLGVQPFEDWAEPLTFYLGTGLEVARIDEVLLEEDGHGGAGGEGENGAEPEPTVEEHGESGERETEVDALIRLGTGWIIHAGSFSIVPNVNFDIVGEDWAMVFGVTLGYRF